MSDETIGKKVALLSLFDPSGGCVFKPEDGETMEVVNEFHGDYDMDWIIQFRADGSERRRFNMKLVEMIEWAD